MNDLCEDNDDPRYASLHGMYAPHCGMAQVLLNWSGTEYVHALLSHQVRGWVRGCLWTLNPVWSLSIPLSPALACLWPACGIGLTNPSTKSSTKQPTHSSSTPPHPAPPHHRIILHY